MTPRVIIQIEQADWEQLQKDLQTLRTLAAGKEQELRLFATQFVDDIVKKLRSQSFSRLLSSQEVADFFERSRINWVDATVKKALDCVAGEQCKVTTETIQP